MKNIAIILLTICLGLSSAAIADEEIDFRTMTVSQLEEVDTAALSKKEKKAYKKALKKQKSAEIKAQKKAAKAEKNRLKKYNKVYKNTQITGSEFDSYIGVTGPEESPGGLGGFFNALSTDVVGARWLLRSYVDSSPVHQAYVTIGYEDNQANGYRQYRSASFRGGVSAQLNYIDFTWGEQNSVTGERHRNEVVTVQIPQSMLFDAFSKGDGITFQVKAKSSDRETVEIPAHYIQGYVRKMADTLNNVPPAILAAGVDVIETGR